MKRLMVLWALAALLLPGLAAAGTTVQPYTFGYLALPDGLNDTYRFAWLRVGARLHPETQVPGTLLVRTEFDISRDSFDNAFKYGYAQWTGDLGEAGKISLLAGKFLSPVSYVWPGPQQTRTISMTKAQRGMPLYGTGVQAFYHGPVNVRLAHVNVEGTDQTCMTGWAEWKGAQVYFVEDLSVGVAYTRAAAWWLNGTIGVTSYDEGERDEFWLEHYFQLDNFRFSTVLEMTEYEDPDWTFTADYAYARFSSLRAGYATVDRTFRSGIAFSY